MKPKGFDDIAGPKASHFPHGHRPWARRHRATPPSTRRCARSGCNVLGERIKPRQQALPLYPTVALCLLRRLIHRPSWENVKDRRIVFFGLSFTIVGAEQLAVRQRPEHTHWLALWVLSESCHSLNPEFFRHDLLRFEKTVVPPPSLSILSSCGHVNSSDLAIPVILLVHCRRPCAGTEDRGKTVLESAKESSNLRTAFLCRRAAGARS